MAVAKDVAEGKSGLGILICGSGIGVSIAANKVDGVRAALVMDAAHAKGSREHNHANVLCFSADRTSAEIICPPTQQTSSTHVMLAESLK